MEGRTDGGVMVDGRMNGWKDGWMKGWKEERVVDEWKEGWVVMDGCDTR